MDIQALLTSIPTIRTGIGLVCFSLVIALMIFRSRNNADLQILKATPPEKIAEVADKLKGRWVIPTDGLTGPGQERLLMAQIRQAGTQKLVAAILLFLFGLFFTYLALNTHDGELKEDLTLPILPASATLAYATSELGTPRTTGSCRYNGRFFPDSIWDNGSLDCATYLYDGLLVDVVYEKADSNLVTSVAYSPDFGSSLDIAGIKSFQNKVPSWSLPTDEEDSPPRTFGEFFDAVGSLECELFQQGYVGSATTPWQHVVACAWTGASNQSPGYTAWRHLEHPESDPFTDDRAWCFLETYWQHMPDDPDFNQNRVRDVCISEYNYRPDFSSSEIRDWVWQGIRTLKIDGYGRFFPSDGDFMASLHNEQS